MDGNSPTSDPARVDRVLGLAGALGGLLWAALPVAAAVAFAGVELGRFGVGGLLAVGALFRFAGLSVVGLLAGTVALRRRFGPRLGRPGQVGIGLTGVGFGLLLPGSVVPSGSLPASLASLVPIGFFVGLGATALGSLTVGLIARRQGIWPSWLALWYALAMPIGAGAGGLFAASGAGNLPLVIGLMVPYGLAWIVLGIRIGRSSR